LHYLGHALGAILIFVGAKMTVSHWYHMPTSLSLGVIVVLLVVAVVASQRRERRLAGLPVPSESAASESAASETVEVAHVAGDDGVAH
jgi:tellurite resistance protein TerC